MNHPESFSTFVASLDPAPLPAWTPAFRDVWRYDLRASIVVLLVALPLCLGIALASGAPLMAGVVTGVIGGIVVGVLSGSHLLVSGPAAGLTAVILTAVTTLGGFPAVLTAIFLAGLMQVGFGLLRAGVIAYYFPNAVIRGMLVGIGLIIILRQLPYAFGADVLGAEAGVMAALGGMQTGALLVSAVALGLLVLWDLPAMKAFAVLPGALVAALACTVLNELLAPGFALSGGQLVTMPVIASLADLDAALAAPQWSAVTNEGVWMVALTIALVASMETLLSLEATDRMDPLKREAPANRELVAQGIGNALCGLFGGLPMTGVIVRSSVNVYAGAKTRASAIIHGVLLLLAVLSIPALLNRIPLAALAMILVHTGWKLAHPRQVRYFAGQGFHQWLPFGVTIVAILLTDLLIGIAAGLAVSLFFILQEHLRSPCFDVDRREPGVVRLRLKEHLTFLHKASLTDTLQELEPGQRVVIDGNACRRIDHDALEVLREFRDGAAERRLDVTILHLDLGASTSLGH